MIKKVIDNGRDQVASGKHNLIRFLLPPHKTVDAYLPVIYLIVVYSMNGIFADYYILYLYIFHI